MKPLISTLWMCAVIGLTACSSNTGGTVRGDLLDQKVAAERIQAALRRAGTAFQHVQVVATNGAVVLAGTVASPQLRSRAEEIARKTPRAHGLQNKLQVGK